MNSIPQTALRTGSPLLILFAFAIPLSTSASSVLAILIITAWLLSGNKETQLSEIIRNPTAVAVLCYLLLHAVGLLWTDNMEWGMDMLAKQWKLLIFPLSLAFVLKKHVSYYLYAFVAAIFLMACKAYLVWLGFITLPEASIFTTQGTTHVVYNPMLAFAVYILLQDLLFWKNIRRIRVLKIFLLFFLSFNMFVTVGRTGQAAFFVLLVIALFQFFFKRSKKLLLTGLLLIPFLTLALFQYCPTFHSRIDTAITEVQNMKSQQVTSMGCRVWFYQNTLLLIKNNWLLGTGTGDFPAEYKKINLRHSPAMPNTDNPHNQYLIITAQFGITGLFILLMIFAVQLKTAFTIKDRLTPLRQAFPLFFLVIMLAESYLQVAATGFLFALLSSFLFKDFSIVPSTELETDNHATL